MMISKVDTNLCWRVLGRHGELARYLGDPNFSRAQKNKNVHRTFDALP